MNDERLRFAFDWSLATVDTVLSAEATDLLGHSAEVRVGHSEIGSMVFVLCGDRVRATGFPAYKAAVEGTPGYSRVVRQLCEIPL